MKKVPSLITCYLILVLACQYNLQAQNYTHADTLRGSVSKARMWWDLNHYDLSVSFNYRDSSIRGKNVIRYKVLQPEQIMQLDLMEPMVLDSVVQDGQACRWKKDGNAYFIELARAQLGGEYKTLLTYFHGKPRVAKQPPWDGGIVWARDIRQRPWISVACQGMASSVWFPSKDHQYDEVDSCAMHFTVPSDLVAVSNGRMRGVRMNPDGSATYDWAVRNPINNYNIIPYIGQYVHFGDTLNGEGGILDLDYWVLQENLDIARKQFAQVKLMLRAFEFWFGKYPFYEDGYKLVEAPYLGMEHQSAIAYGNKYKNGYLGTDLSLTGWGLKWDFIIVHESGHEWFGNNMTVKDVADNWVHEGFTAYSECLFVQSQYGKKAADDYIIGTRIGVLNDEPVIAAYNVNRDGSGDMYYKAANMLHIIRQIAGNDSLFRSMLRDMNTKFWHQTVTSVQIENYMANYLNLDLQKIFDQYLRTTRIPMLEFKQQGRKISYRWTNCVKHFDMPLKLILPTREFWINPTEKWQKTELSLEEFRPDPNFFIRTRRLN
ncbi:MAG TPA: M1 family metallopeptidase [Bacteroidia bacterium]|nr:M1 family metallopeptidase [Bacteroidia bacterium]